MLQFDQLARISALPIVNLRDIASPIDGVLCQVPAICSKNFEKSNKCRKHYELLHGSPHLDRQPLQCPFGFTTFSVSTQQAQYALTAVIPHPRLGGAEEKRQAKAYPQNKIPIESLRRTASALQSVEEQLGILKDEAVNRHSFALHEIRKLNRTVKQTAERLCRNERPEAPDTATPELVQIWKSAELMSRQFDAIELLANESLAQLPLKTPIQVYRIFDKCVRIYRPPTMPDRITIRSPPNYDTSILACDKTFPIIPTALIENALRYALPGTSIVVDIHPQGSRCIVETTNIATWNPSLTSRIFEKGVRATSDADGSGNGLYLAKLVVEQHKGTIQLSKTEIAAGKMECVFTVSLPGLTKL